MPKNRPLGVRDGASQLDLGDILAGPHLWDSQPSAVERVCPSSLCPQGASLT